MNDLLLEARKLDRSIVFRLLELIFTAIGNEGIDQEPFMNAVLEMYDVSREEYAAFLDEVSEKDFDWQNPEVLNAVSEVYEKEKRNYFTISSKTDFDSLLAHGEGARSMFYHPLNDHSRGHLSKGDVLFCYRQGQFGSLAQALDTRGIYALGIAMTDPIEFFPNNERHYKYGIIVYFPVLLDAHLQLRNIQLHPHTIDLTPYNGNRNDALQHIPDERHYMTLLGLIAAVNPHLKRDFEDILGVKVQSAILPDNHWDNAAPASTGVPLDFDIDVFLKDLADSGFILEKKMVTRFVASLCAKPFVILTGLSGSGKTQLALSFARWICGNERSHFQLLRTALETDTVADEYEVVRCTPDILEVIHHHGSERTIIPLPTALIYEWYDAIKSGAVGIDEEPELARHTIAGSSSYAEETHSYCNALHRIAVAMNRSELKADAAPVKQYEIVAVGPEWTNREPLLGYPNALQPDRYECPENGVLELLKNANSHPDRPFFLILDEMNLSHVERYFADFLSVMESGEAISLYSESENRYPVPSRIRLPDNLFIIGTVNIDETTYMFSPKVLDRANTIEFRVDAEDMERYFEGPRRVWPESLVSRGAEMAAGFLNMSRTVSGTASNDEECISVLLLFFNELQKLGAEFGYRSAHEISRLFGQLRRVDKAMADDDIIDIVLMQKLLPRLHGARRRICPVLEKMAQLCVNDANPGFEQDFLKSDMAGLAKYGIKYPMSLEKICRMHSNAVEHGFASYAEA